MQTPTLRLALPDDLVSVFPKVLRGTKLVPSQRLELYRSEDAFAFARRCLLVVMTPTLLFLGAVLPGVLPDWLLSLSAVALLSVVHVFGRWIEILQLFSGTDFWLDDSFLRGSSMAVLVRLSPSLLTCEWRLSVTVV